MPRGVFRKGSSGPAQPAAPATPARPTLRDLGQLDTDAPVVDDRSERYAAWADRMRAKRARFQGELQSTGDEADGLTYWTTEVLFEESKRLDEEEVFERPSARRVHELLSVLDLTDGATPIGLDAVAPEEIGAAYRRLAKVHHPDRYLAADEATQAFHAAEMARINAAYRALRSLQQA